MVHIVAGSLSGIGGRGRMASIHFELAAVIDRRECVGIAIKLWLCLSVGLKSIDGPPSEVDIV